MRDLIIVGAGPAGLTAAIYAKRAGLDVAVIEKGAPGGKVFVTHQIDNYPGIETISGRELATNMHKHAIALGTEYIYGDVLRIEDLGSEKKVVTNLDEYLTKNVIIATGTQNKTLDAKGEEEFLGRGVSYCAVCDGNFFKNEDVAVIGGGNSAIEEALYLADICKSVTIVHRRQEFRAESFSVDALKKRTNINYQLDSVLEEICGDDKVNNIIVKNVHTDVLTTIPVKGVFIYVGLIPIVENFKNLNIFNSAGELVVDEKTMATNIKGIYVAGDVRPKSLRQVATAVSDGAIAAQSIVNDNK